MDDIATSTAASAGTRWLNLGIGNPAAIPEVTARWRQLTGEALADSFADVSCSYGPSSGRPELIAALVDYFNRRYGWGIGPANVVVGPGSQMLCFMAAGLFTGPGTPRPANLILPMIPDYTGYEGLCMTPGGIAGIEPELLREGERFFRYQFDFAALESRTDAGMILLSSPSNPTGRCVDEEEMATLIAVAENSDIPMLLDNAYGEPFPCITDSSLAPVWHDNVINCFTLSKTGLAGERIGFAIGHEKYITPLVSFLSNSALHASQLAQMIVARALETGTLDTMTAVMIRPFYVRRRKQAESLLLDALPARVPWRLHLSQGGMFCWIWVEGDWFDDLTFYQVLKDKNVFVVPGRHFFIDPAGNGRLGCHARQCFRVSISADEMTLVEGAGRIAETLAELCPNRQRDVPRKYWEGAMADRREDFVEADFEAPQGGLEQVIVDISAEVLGVDRISRSDSFYDFGTTSLQAIRICARIEQKVGIRVPPAWIFLNDIVADLAQQVQTDGLAPDE